MQELWEILVPTHWNDGTLIDISYHKEWDDYCRQISGGMTILKPAIGEWENRREGMIPVRLIAEKQDIYYLLSLGKVHYQQEKMMAYKISEEVIIE